MVDWAQYSNDPRNKDYYGNPNSAGIDWAAIGGGPQKPTKAQVSAVKAKVRDEVLAEHGFDQHPGGLLGLADNALDDVGSLVKGFIPGVVEGAAGLGHMILHPHDLTQPVGGHTGWAPLDEILNSGGHPKPGSTFITNTATPGPGLAAFVENEGHNYGSALHGNFHPLYEHPLSPLLDAATVLTGGEGGLIRAGEFAGEGSRLGRLGEDLKAAREGRTVGGEGVRPFDAPGGKNVAVRAVQGGFDRFSQTDFAHDYAPPFSVQNRAARALAGEAGRRSAMNADFVNRFKAVLPKLSKPEQLSLFFRRQGIHPLDYREMLEDTENRLHDAIAKGGPGAQETIQHLAPSSIRRQQLIKALSDPELTRVVESAPSPNLARAETLLRQMGARNERAMTDLGRANPDTLEARAFLPQRLLTGERYEPARSVLVPRHDPFAADRSAMEKEARRAETELRQATRRHVSLTERVRSYDQRLKSAGDDAPKSLVSQALRARKQLAEAKTTLAEAKTKAAYLRDGVGRVPDGSPAEWVKTDAEMSGGKSLRDVMAGEIELRPIHESAGTPGYVPHYGPPEAQPAAYRPRKGAPLTEAPKQGFEKMNKGIRFLTGNLSVHPEIFGIDYVRKSAIQIQSWYRDELAEHVAQPLDEDAVGTAGLNDTKHWAYLRTRKTGPVDRVTKEAAAFTQASHEAQLLDAAKAEKEIADSAKDTVFHQLPDDLKGLSIKELNERGIRQIPNPYAKEWEKQFRATTHNVLTDMLDKPIKVWKALLLLGRPAFATYNIVSQHILYALHYAGKDGFGSYLRSLRDVIGEPALRKLAPALRRVGLSVKGPEGDSAIEALDDVLPSLRSSAFTHSEQGVPGGMYEFTKRGQLKMTGTLVRPGGTTELGAAGKVLYNVGRVPLKPFETFGKVIGKLNNVVADDLPRVAAAYSEAERNASVIAIQDHARKLEGLNLTAMDALKRINHMDPEEGQRVAIQIMKGVDDATGDYRHMTAVERQYIKRYVSPFWSWYRNIMLISGRLLRDSPGKVLALQILGNSARQASAELNLPMPSWLADYLPVGDGKNGVIPILDLQSLNPFDTPLQFVDQLRSLLPKSLGGQPATGSSNPISLLSPYVQAIDAVRGIDSSTGEQHRGLGARQGGVVAGAGQFLGSFPQVSYGQQALGGVNVPGTDYAPIHSAYPSSLYTQRQRNALLAYLGIPIKDVNVAAAKAYHDEGR